MHSATTPHINPSRRLALLLVSLFTTTTASHLAMAQQPPADFPIKPIRLIVPFAPGSGTDVVGRVVSERLAERLRVPIVVENKDGAGGVIGTQLAAKAPADGYTLLMVTNSTIIAPQLQSPPAYDPLNALAWVSRAARIPLALVASANAPFKTARELVEYAKTNPGKISFATSGRGSQSEIEVEYLKQVFGIDMVDIPYKSGPQGAADVVAGNVPLYLTTLAMLGPHIKTGKVRALAVGGAQRSSIFPDSPTFGEALGLSDYQPAAWFGIAAPKGTPDSIVRKLSFEVLALMKEEGVKSRLDAMGAEPAYLPSEEFVRQVRDEAERWAKVVSARGRR